MPEDKTDTPETPSSDAADPAGANPGVPTKPVDDNQGQARESDDELPEWARKKLTKANAEAATYRTRLREVEQKLQGAKSPEEFEQVKTRNAELEASLLRERVARKYGLDDDLADRLRGQTEEEMDADAKKLQRYATPQPPRDLRGGLDPTDEDESFDPVAAARRARKTRY